MRFMVMHKMTAELEKGPPPPPEVLAGISKLIEDGLEQKVFVSGAGLKPSAQRLHIAYRKGRRTITDGPFTEAKELVAGFALLRVRSRDEAIAWTDRFAAAMGDVELFLGPVVEPWDLAGAPGPADAPMRFLAMHKADERAEQEAPPDARVASAMGALVAEMKQAGVLEATGGLLSTKRGARLRFKGGRHTVVDGPFAESKELVAGFAILELPSKAAAIEWAVRFGDIVKVDEVEVRQMCE